MVLSTDCAKKMLLNSYNAFKKLCNKRNTSLVFSVVCFILLIEIFRQQILVIQLSTASKFQLFITLSSELALFLVIQHSSVSEFQLFSSLLLVNSSYLPLFHQQIQRILVIQHSFVCKFQLFNTRASANSSYLALFRQRIHYLAFFHQQICYLFSQLVRLASGGPLYCLNTVPFENGTSPERGKRDVVLSGVLPGGIWTASRCHIECNRIRCAGTSSLGQATWPNKAR